MSKAEKVLITAAGPNMVPVLERFSLPAFQRFAEQQGYDVHAEVLPEDSLARKDGKAKDARWQKIPLIRKFLGEYGTAAWFDADVVIRRYTDDIARHLGSNAFQGLVLHHVPAEDRINPNTGVWVFNNSPEAFDFLDTVEEIGMPDGRWADQGAVMRALGWECGDERYHGARIPKDGSRFMAGTTWLPTDWNEPYCGEGRPNPEAYVGRPQAVDPHAIHFMAMTIEDRMKYMGNVDIPA